MSQPEPPTNPKKKSDSRELVKTKTPGIYKRVNSAGKTTAYVVTYRAGGKQRKQHCRTLDQARAVKRAHEADRDRGEFQERTKITFREFLAEWIDRYHGNGKRGFREGTRGEYRRILDTYAHEYFGERLRLVDVNPSHLTGFVAWLMDENKQGRRLADETITNIVTPVKAALSTARREGLIRWNPADDLALPHREEIDEGEEEEVRALSRQQLATLIEIAPEKYKLLIELMACTGLRVSEAIGLQRRHLHLDGSRPHVRVRRGVVKRRIEPPKTKYAKRSVPLPASLVFKLRTHLATLDDSPNALVFPSRNGTPLDPDNIRKRNLKPLMQEVGAPWAAFHTLRHTFASIQLARGVNVLQLSRVLGHHSPAFTLSRYCHLLEGDEAPPLDLNDDLIANTVDDLIATAA